MNKQKFKPKKLQDQTIVITGASSGIGLATAKMAAAKGARVVLAARNGEALDEIVKDITKAGGKAIAVTTDVSRFEEVSSLRDKALAEYGCIDTWINNAGTSIYGYLMDSDIEEEKKLFETNFWGARNGSILAVEEMKEKGGVLINLGSEVSVASQPLLGIYSATKHALKAYTEALRSELRDRNLPVEVCLVRPTAIDTPFPEHGANRLDQGEPSLPSPMYHPDVAAAAILKCAENPQRDVYVGGPARLSAILDTFFPQVKDMMAESQMKDLKKGTSLTHTEKEEGLHHASKKQGKVQGHTEGKVSRSSAYTEITTLSVLKTLKDNFKSSLAEKRRHESH